MGRKRKLIDTEWTGSLAYAIGLIASDGNLSPDLRHISLTSKDRKLVANFKNILSLSNKIGRKGRGGSTEKKYYVIQFGSVDFYNFLLSIGLSPAKSKTIDRLLVPDLYFFDFLRGSFDGDGNINEFVHPQSRHLQLRFRLASASPPFLNWIHTKIKTLLKIKGGWVYADGKRTGVSTLTFGKTDAIKIFRAMYHVRAEYFLKRKHKTATTYL